MTKTPQVPAIAGMTPLGLQPKAQKERQAHDLGEGWNAIFNRDGSLTLVNLRTLGDRLDVPAASVERLRTILAKTKTPKTDDL